MTRSLGVLLLAACGSSPATIDAAQVGSEASPCVAFVGELVDWDSSDAQFCGIFGAGVQAHGDPSTAKTTPPNGRIELCIPSAARVSIDITPPAAASQCTTPTSTYSIPGTIIVDQAVLSTGAVASARLFTLARAPAFGYDPTKAQVFVHVVGTPGAVSITGTHDAAQALGGTGWAPGATGADVYFPNVDASSGSTAVDLAGGLGTGNVPLTAGAFTYLTLVGN